MQAPMRRGAGAMLTTCPFVVSLATLIANDCWLKASYPGLVTGKLSDVAGIAVVALLAFAQFSRPLVVYAGIAAAFAWWKSPLSQPLIEAVKGVSPIIIGRTVDYWDLFALLVMPACAAVVRRQQSFNLPGDGTRRLLRVPLIAVTAFAVMATPATPPQLKVDEVRTFQASEGLKREEIAKAFAEVAARHDLDCQQCDNLDQRKTYRKDGVFLSYEFFENALVVSCGAETLGEEGTRKVETLAGEIKQRLAEIQPGLGYIETLNGRVKL